jgi:hypothetical protein
MRPHKEPKGFSCAVAEAIRQSFQSDVVLRSQARRHLLHVYRGRTHDRSTDRCAHHPHARSTALVKQPSWRRESGHLHCGSGRMDLHRKPFEAAQHIVIMACGFSGELDRFDLANEGAENRFTFEPSHCLPDAAVNAGS